MKGICEDIYHNLRFTHICVVRNERYFHEKQFHERFVVLPRIVKQKMKNVLTPWEYRDGPNHI